MVHEFLQFIASQKLIQNGEKVLLSVSGGKDSMCMAEMFRISPFEIGIAHLNHGMRGKESDLDEELVKNYAESNGIKFHSQKIDLSEVESNFQSVARQKRIKWLKELASEFGYHKIATAHHLDDQVENFLIRLNRNSGLKGLKGMTPLNGILIKPLLFTYRNKIENYIDKKNIPFRDDRSNFSDKYDRNYIRNKIIPLVEVRYPDFSKSIIASMLKINEAYETIEDFTLLIEKNMVSKENNRIYVQLNGLESYSRPLFVLYNLLSKYGLNRTQSDNLFNAETGSIIQSEELVFLKDRNRVIIRKRKDAQKEEEVFLDKNCIKMINHSLGIRIQSIEMDKVEKQSSTIYIDEESVEWPLNVRSRKSGDLFYPLGMKLKRKKLKKFLIDQKQSKFDKEQVRLLVDSEDRIIWVIGFRQDERFKISENSKHISKIQLQNYEI